ncbi:hypothetical protein [Nocardia takedensis]|uniref:hypothetical protein n=1 Tax=Nocardia takedensis TaxID=259390 RepID=UPI000305837D|nr:hypothetical protein [Nocardia takedensis]
MTDSLDNDALDALLAEHSKNLLKVVARELDIDAGLREALIETRHIEFARGLRDVLDVESGLAAIIPAVQLKPIPSPQAEEWDIVDAVLALEPPLAARLELRHMAAAAMTDAMAVARRIADVFASIAKRTGGVGDAAGAVKQVDAGLRKISDQLGYVLIEDAAAHVLDGGDGAAAEWLEHVRRFLRVSMRRIEIAVHEVFCAALQGTESQTPATQLTDSLAAARAVHRLLERFAHGLFRFEKVLNNFIGEDLSAVDLVGVHLSGVRWSDDTRWPEDWRDEIEHNSDQISEGIYEIRSSIGKSVDVLIDA